MSHDGGDADPTRTDGGVDEGRPDADDDRPDADGGLSDRYRAAATLLGVVAGFAVLWALDRDPVGNAVVAVLVTVGVPLALVLVGALVQSALRGR